MPVHPPPPSSARQIALAIPSIYLGSIAVSQPLVNRVFQRDTRTGGLYGSGIGDILLTVNPSQPITLLQYRLRDADCPHVVIQDWATGTLPLNAGQQVIALAAPAGLKRYLIDLRANSDDTSDTSTTNGVMVGELVAFSGQSLAEDFVSTAASGDPTTISSLGLTTSNWGFIFAAYASNTGPYPPVPDGPDVNYPPAGWQKPADAGIFRSTWFVEFANRLITLLGVPIGLIGYAVGGSGIVSWLPGYTGVNAGHWDKLVNVLTLAGGKFGTFLWDQGHYETKNGNTASNYLAQLQLLFASLNTAFPVAFRTVIGTIPSIGNYGGGPTAIAMVRDTAKQYAAGAPSTAYVDGRDSALMPDLVHPSQAGNITYARHWYRATANLLGAQIPGDHGPTMVGASRAYGSRWIYIAVDQINGGTGWQAIGTPANQFHVFLAGTTRNPLALDEVTPIDVTNPAQIGLHLASAPIEPQAFDVWYRRPPDNSTIIGSALYDNVLNADGITQGRMLWDPAAAIAVPAPTLSFTFATIADTDPSATIVVSGTYAPVAPPSLDYSLDGGGTWTGAGATIGGGNFSFTIAAGPATPGLYAVTIRDHVTVANTGVSNAFLVIGCSVPTAPMLANPLFAMDAYHARDCLFRSPSASVQGSIGYPVQAVVDLSGNSNDFAQAIAANSPTLIANQVNGLPALRFVRASLQALLQSGGNFQEVLRTSSAYVIIVVFKPDSLPATIAQDVMTIGSAYPQGGDKLRIIQQLTTGTVRTSRNADNAFNNLAAPSVMSAGTLIKAVIRWDGTNQRLLVNAQAEVAGAVTGAFNNVWQPSSVIGASLDPEAEFYLDGLICEIRIWNTAASDTVRDNLMSYMTTKWGS